MDFNIDPGYSPTRGVDMALDVAWVQISPWPKVVVQATQTSMAPVAAWPSDINMAQVTVQSPGIQMVPHDKFHFFKYGMEYHSFTDIL